MQSANGKRHNLLLTGIATAISTLVAVLIILINTDLNTQTRVAIASTAALAVFGVFAVKFYRTRERVRVEPSNPVNQRCLILAAPTHGVLQDRANYWLSGKYGKVISSTMSTTEKGFYMAIFYESMEMKELPLKEAKK